MCNLKSKLSNEVQRASKIIYILWWVFIVLMIVLLVLRHANGENKESFWLNVDYWLMFFVLLDLVILNRVASKMGIENEKFVFCLISGLFLLNLLWIVEKIMTKDVPVLDESVFLPNRLNYIVLILGLILLSLNKGPLGFWLKKWFLKFRDPRAFIVLALIFLIITPFLLIVKQEPVAEKTANMAYFMLVIGVLGQLVEYLRESRKPLNKNKSLDKT